MIAYSRYSKESKPRKRGTGALRRIGFICFYSTTAILIVLRIATWLNAEELFTLNSIVVQGNRLVSEQEILNIMKSDTATNLFKNNLRLLAAKISRHPYIKSASVSRRLPDNLVIRVEENEPLALLNSEHITLLDEAGAPLPYTQTVQVIDYPVVFNAEIGSEATTKIIEYLLACRQEHFSLYSEINEISYSEDAGLYFYLIDHAIPIVMGKDNFDNKSTNLVQVLKILESNNELNQVKALDLRFKNQVIVKTKLG